MARWCNGAGAEPLAQRPGDTRDDLFALRSPGSVSPLCPTCAPVKANGAARKAHERDKCCVRGLELRNVVANYPFENLRGFSGSEPNSGHGDYSRLSCSAGDTQLGAGFCRDLQQAFCTGVGHHAASPRRHELAAISHRGFVSRFGENIRLSSYLANPLSENQN